MQQKYKLTPVAAVVMAFAAQAQTQTPSTPSPARQAGDPDSVTTVVISASPLGLIGADMISPVTSLDGNELMRLRESTLGETLGSQRGISSSHFGAGASRPIIRGMDGPRVKILSDGAEVQDASTISPDHAVGFEPLLAERIEVLRGPSALAFGGGAVGGVVNVLDRKIPTRMPVQPVEGSVELRANSGARERAGAFEVTGAAGSFAVHAEGVKRSADDYRVGKGWPDGGRVAGSYRDSTSGSMGLSWIGARGYLGAAFTSERADYGIPGHEEEFIGCHPHDDHLDCGGHDAEEEEGHDDHEHGAGVVPTVKLDSKRWDLRGELGNPFAGVKKVRLRASYTDYRHDEMEEGAILTTFASKGHDARLEFEHEPIGPVRGVVGLQTTRRDFSAVGEESYLSPSLTRKNAFFVTEELRAGAWRFEGAVRHEWQDIDVRNPAYANTSADGTSFSVGAVWRFAPEYSLRSSLSHSHRLPTAEELYADGVHLATSTYEMGNQALDKETSQNFDLTLRKFKGDTTFSLGIYRNRVKDFIFADTLDAHESFQLIQYAQRDALFTGVDAELKHKFSKQLNVTVYADSVRARFDSGNRANLPRIPAQRMGVKLDGDWNEWHGFVEFYRVRGQDRLASFETATPGYNMVNLGTHINARVAGVPVQFFARLNNLNDALAYGHSSFIKWKAPLMGRNATLGLRMSF
jgi:iron complex outermembrane receptor protein